MRTILTALLSMFLVTACGGTPTDPMEGKYDFTLVANDPGNTLGSCVGSFNLAHVHYPEGSLLGTRSVDGYEGDFAMICGVNSFNGELFIDDDSGNLSISLIGYTGVFRPAPSAVLLKTPGHLKVKLVGYGLIDVDFNAINQYRGGGKSLGPPTDP
jgi:hypothetical protein